MQQHLQIGRLSLPGFLCSNQTKSSGVEFALLSAIPQFALPVGLVLDAGTCTREGRVSRRDGEQTNSYKYEGQQQNLSGVQMEE